MVKYLRIFVFYFLFGEISLQKCEEYFDDDILGSEKNGELYQEIVCFMIVGLKESITYVIKSSPEITVNAVWLRDELFECLDILCQCDFDVREIACDNHHCNVSTFEKLLKRCNQIQTIYV